VFGFKFIPDDDQFCWYVAFTPSSRYPALDNRVARAWENAPEHGNRPGFRHLATETKVQFVSRTLADGLPATTAKEDVDAVMKFLFGTESEIAKFGGAEPSASAPSAGA
jgi:hypothetical protein